MNCRYAIDRRNATVEEVGRNINLNYKLKESLISDHPKIGLEAAIL